MNKKVVIQIIIIVGAFAAAGFILYNGLFKNDSSSATMANVPLTEKSEKILPYGSSLDFKTDLYKRNFKFNSISYPQVDPQNEVGIPEASLVTPLDIK